MKQALRPCPICGRQLHQTEWQDTHPLERHAVQYCERWGLAESPYYKSLTAYCKDDQFAHPDLKHTHYARLLRQRWTNLAWLSDPAYNIIVAAFYLSALGLCAGILFLALTAR